MADENGLQIFGFSMLKRTSVFYKIPTELPWKAVGLRTKQY